METGDAINLAESNLELDPTMDSSSATADHDGSPESRSTIARCTKCNTDFAEFYNGWQQITGSYYLPSLAGSYSSPGLHPKSKPKLAAAESALHGCTIQPLACNNCEEVLAIACIKAHEDKNTYAEREFFKLPKIQLRSESSGNPVEAIIEDDHQPVSQKPQRTIDTTNMERSAEAAVATIQKPSLPPMSVIGRQSSADPRHELPATRTVPSQPLQPRTVMPERDASLQPRSRLSSHSVAPSPTGHGVQHPTTRVNGTVANNDRPSEQAIEVSAIDRIQTQVSSDRAMLETFTRDMSRLETSFKKMQEEFQNTINDIRMELRASRQQVAAIPHPERIEDEALEVFSSTLSGLVTKTAEIDVLKVKFEVIKQRLRYLEGGTVAPAPADGYIPHQRAASLQRPLIAQHRPHVPSQHQLPEPRLLPSQPAQHVPYTPEPTSQRQPTQQEQAAAIGWNTVNTGLKRALPSNGDSIDTPLGSPKRAKLAPMEARYNYPEQPSTATASSYYQHRSTEEPIGSQAYQQAPPGSYPDATHPSAFMPYTQDGSSDESWRPVSQRAVSNPAHGRGRGRGRGGRSRKSMPLEPHLIATPAWEKDGWTGSQIEADGYYRSVPAKRGSGGGPGSAMVSPIHAVDPFGHTKRPRTKPSRNAEGILIRKDGRPDLRSQSSAANLRKVHAKKEEERLAAGGSPLPPGEEPYSAAGSPASNDDSHDLDPPNTQERTGHIMKGMFPRGIDEARARLKTAQQYFSSVQSQAGTSASTPTQNAVNESEAIEGMEVDRARGDSPQQQHGIVKETQIEAIAPAAQDINPPATEQTATPVKSTEPSNTIEFIASEPTISSTTVQAS